MLSVTSRLICQAIRLSVASTIIASTPQPCCSGSPLVISSSPAGNRQGTAKLKKAGRLTP